MPRREPGFESATPDADHHCDRCGRILTQVELSYGWSSCYECHDKDDPAPSSTARIRPATQRLRYWLRWLAILPSGIIAVLAVSFPIHWFVLLGSQTSQGEADTYFGVWDLPAESLERVVQAFFAAFVFVFVGAFVAPEFKLHAAVVLMVGWSMLLGSAMTYGATTDAYQGWLWLEYGLVVSLGVAGVLIAGYLVHESQRRSEESATLISPTEQTT